ncbi:MAG: hypothetical protein AAF587_24200 [Bacteroidota bacterium]
MKRPQMNTEPLAIMLVHPSSPSSFKQLMMEVIDTLKHWLTPHSKESTNANELQYFF